MDIQIIIALVGETLEKRQVEKIIISLKFTLSIQNKAEREHSFEFRLQRQGLLLSEYKHMHRMVGSTDS